MFNLKSFFSVMAGLFMCFVVLADEIDLTPRIPQSTFDAEKSATEKKVPPWVIKRFKAIVPVFVEIEIRKNPNIIEKKWMWVGSGFFISKDMVLTALHVAGYAGKPPLGEDFPRAVFAGGELVNGFVPGSDYYDEENDLAIIKLSKEVQIDPVPIARKDPKIRNNVYAYGYSFLDRPTWLRLEYAGDTYSLSADNQRRILVTIRNFESGYSGSPLLNVYGQAIGVNVRTTVFGVFGLAVPWDVVQEFLNKVPEFKEIKDYKEYK